MNEEENTIDCPECSSKLLDDVYKGEIVCSGCGIVVEEQTADYGPESISSACKHTDKNRQCMREHVPSVQHTRNSVCDIPKS